MKATAGEGNLLRSLGIGTVAYDAGLVERMRSNAVSTIEVAA